MSQTTAVPYQRADWPLAAMPNDGDPSYPAPFFRAWSMDHHEFAICRICGAFIADGFLRTHWENMHPTELEQKLDLDSEEEK